MEICKVKPFAESFYKSKAWKNCRDAYMKQAGGLCEDCLAKGIYTPAEIVHHIIPLDEKTITDPSIALNPALLKAVCRECHAAEHGAKQRRYNLDELGRVTVK